MVSAGVTEFLTLLAILFGGGMIGAWLMHKINFPTILGFILIGIIVGPFGLGIIQDTDLINLLAEFGIIILLFVVGLEFSIKKLQKVGLGGIIIGTIQLAIVFSLGYVVALALDWTHLEALFLGSILSITSTAVSLRFLRDLKLVNTKEWNTVVIILIVEDLAAVLLLTILGNASIGGNVSLLDFGTTIIESIVFFVITFGIGIKLVPKLLAQVEKINMEEALFITSLSLAFGLGVLAHLLHLSSAIGAFLMGMIIASSKFSESVTHKVLPLRDFFIIIFFVSIGMLVNISLLQDNFWIAIPIIVVAIVGKFLGNMFSASLAGNTLISASTIGAMMIPIGEFSFIIAKIGVDSGTISESIYPITIMVSLVTMLAMPLLLRILPTTADNRTIIPQRLLNSIYLAGIFLKEGTSIGKKSESGDIKSKILKKYGKVILVHFVIITAILILINYFSPTIVSLLEDPNFPIAMDPSIVLGVLIVLILGYPLFSLFGKTEKLISSISDKITINIASREKDLVDKPVHKVIRNILFIGIILLLVAIFVSFLDFENSNLKVILSTIGFAISIPLILDTIFAVRKITQTHVFDSLVSDED